MRPHLTVRARTTGRRLLIGTVLVTVAGTMTTHASGQPGAAALRFQRPVALPHAQARTEPSLVVDSAGRIFVSAIGGLPGSVGGSPTDPQKAPGTPVYRSIDGGRTFTAHVTCSAGPVPTNLAGGDSALVLDKRDYLYGTDLWLGDDSGWVSKDHGDSCLGSPASHRPLDDRNWLAYSRPDDAIYQIYDGFDGLWVSRADLGTALAENTALASPINVQVAPEDAAGVGSDSPYVRDTFAPPGGIAVDQHSGTVYAAWPDQRGVAIATSHDKAITWAIDHIPGTSVHGTTNDDLWNFTPVATDSRGGLYVAWSQVIGPSATSPAGIGMWLGWSTDGGKHWKKTRVPTRRTAVFPTLAVYSPGRLAVGYVDADQAGDPNSGGFGEARWRLGVTVFAELLTGHPTTRSGAVDNDVHEGTLFVGPQGGDRGMGDFLSMTVTPRGALVVAYTRGQANGKNQAMVAVLPAGK